MRILADENIPGVEAYFGDIATVISYAPGRAINTAQIAACDLLLVRSVTPVNASLLQQHRPRFIGSATIGIDHIDVEWLAKQQIPFAHAPGCNADAVGDYVLTALLYLHADAPQRLADKTVSVIGAGNVGGRLVKRLRALGLTVRVCDPPRAEQTPEAEAFVTLADAMQADVVCVHTPLTGEGAHPTRHLISDSMLSLLAQNAILLNAGRGAVVSAAALERFLPQRPDVQVVLDVWEPEPDIPRILLPQVRLATGHIAGYSLEGKWRGTQMLRAALNRVYPEYDRPLPDMATFLPPAPRIVVLDDDPWQALYDSVEAVYDIAQDDRRFRLAMRAEEPARAFDQYRKTYVQRREIQQCRVLVQESPARPLLRAAGFQLPS